MWSYELNDPPQAVVIRQISTSQRLEKLLFSYKQFNFLNLYHFGRATEVFDAAQERGLEERKKVKI